MYAFNKSNVPNTVANPDGVDRVNAIIDLIASKRIEFIAIQEEGTLYRTANLILVYAHSQLRRALMLLASIQAELSAGRDLVAMSGVRSLYETIANFLDFEKDLSAIREIEDLQRVQDFIRARTFATRLDDLKGVAGSSEAAAKSVLTQIDKMKDVCADVRDDYNYLCEYTHPNALGGVLYFSRNDANTDITSFTDESPEPLEGLRWALKGASLLLHFSRAFERIEQKLPSLSEKAKKAAKHR